MSTDESFLARWFRRKRGTTPTARGQSNPKSTGDTAASKAAAASLSPEETQSLFDSTSLPPIESICTGSDIRPFLAPGVPADLTRAALRRAWSADPAIRDFIGLSENSWDFNAPGGVPGSGSLTAADARRLLARMMGEIEMPQASEPTPPAAERSSDDQPPLPASEASRPIPDPVAEQIKLVGDSDADHRNSMPGAETSNIAMQHERGKQESHLSVRRHRHGGALPD
jgi:hypothetical protein